MQTVQEQIGQVIAEAERKIGDLLRQHVTTIFAAGAVSRPVVSVPTPRKALPTVKAKESKARFSPPHCIVPGCSNPHLGPRTSYTCNDHLHELTKEKRSELYAQFKAMRKA